MPEGRVEILDYSRYAVPHGEMEFARSGLIAPPPQQPQAPPSFAKAFSGVNRLPSSVEVAT